MEYDNRDTAKAIRDVVRVMMDKVMDKFLVKDDGEVYIH